MQSAPQHTNDMELPLSMRPAIIVAVHSHDQISAVAGLNGLAHLRFDQTAVEATARMHGIALTPDEAGDLAILQAEGLKIMRSAS